MIINDVFQLIESRKTASPKNSYVAGLLQEGPDKILKKIAEEAGEVIIASKNPGKEPVTHELCDLLFHSLVLMAHLEIEPEQVCRELQRRFGVSGLEEKKNRS